MTRPLTPLSLELSEQLRNRLRRLLVRVDEMRALAQQPGAWQPPLDVCETENAILIRVELPGVVASQVRITLRDNLLKVEGRKDRALQAPQALESLPETQRPTRFLCLEREYGTFAVRVVVKWLIEATQIHAQFHAGVLHIRLPKAKTAGHEIIIPINEV